MTLGKQVTKVPRDVLSKINCSFFKQSSLGTLSFSSFVSNGFLLNKSKDNIRDFNSKSLRSFTDIFFLCLS